MYWRCVSIYESVMTYDIVQLIWLITNTHTALTFPPRHFHTEPSATRRASAGSPGWALVLAHQPGTKRPFGGNKDART